MALDSSDWRCSCVSEESNYRYRGNQGAGACPMTPDFRIPGGGCKSGKQTTEEGRGERRRRRGAQTDGGRRSGTTRKKAWELRRSQGDSGTRARGKRRGDAQTLPHPRRGTAEQGFLKDSVVKPRRPGTEGRRAGTVRRG
ncbi:hypothetical protein NDU88_002739 [Pleurodeles waltl]|uniref:Uncharacterized protein n=1 Tax=Pleurodeles waltl TaxID=8319 RepID=A0AAV7KWA0_PLEWA|nr:hypothetical protein NDU88_002739 [Pleurodeles waltl]